MKVGLLVSFTNAVNDGLAKKAHNPMGSLYVFDAHTEIIAPGDCPPNWPSGLIRIYRNERRAGSDPEFTLHHFDPAVNAAGWDDRWHGSMDQTGLRRAQAEGYYQLEAHYLVVSEFGQLSFIPLQGDHKDDPAELLAAVKNLTAYDKKEILRVFDEAKVKQPYNEDDLESTKGVPHTYANWLLLNALLAARLVALRQVALSELGDQVLSDQLARDSKTQEVLAIDVGEDEEPDPEQVAEMERLNRDLNS
jgi:hypothetical protein